MFGVGESIEEECSLIEANDPPIGSIDLWYEMSFDQLLLAVSCYDQGQHADFDFDVRAWRRIGKATQGINLERFDFYLNGFDMTEITPPAAACLGALYSQIKRARSIEEFWITLFADGQVMPNFDLRQFIESNASLRSLAIKSLDDLTSDQVDMLRAAIADWSFLTYPNVILQTMGRWKEYSKPAPVWDTCLSVVNSSPIVQHFRPFSKIRLHPGRIEIVG